MDNALKDKIVAGAAKVLVREGMQNWSVDRVAAEVGCGKGLIAYHHGTKQSLLAAVAAYVTGGIDAIADQRPEVVRLLTHGDRHDHR